MSEIQPVVMPKWGLAMSEGTLTSWLVAEGSEVKKGDDLAEIETTKISNVFESPTGGKIRRQLVQGGDIVPVGALLAVVAGDDVSDTDIDAFVSSFVVDTADDGGAPKLVEAEADFGGRKVFYRLAGKDSEGTPIVLIHGFGGDADNWVLNQQPLAEHHPVYALDLPGHGRSSKTVDKGDLYELADAVVAVMDAGAITKAHLVGHSLGAAVAFAVLGRYPDKVCSITGLAPAGLGETVNDAYIQGFINAEKRKEVKAALQMLVADPDKVSANMIEGIQRFKRLENVKDALVLIASKTMAAGRQTASFRELVETSQIPMQVIWGKKDIIIDPNHGEGLPSRVRVDRLDGIGHMPHLEASETVNQRVLDISRT